VLGADGAVAVTVTLNEQLVVLPDRSVAVHVTVVVPCVNTQPLAGVQLVVTPGQLSLAVGPYVTIGVLQVLVVMLPGHLIVGGVVSLTVTVKLQLMVLPETSVNVQLTGVVPVANVAPFVG
jgi:hypothetical protein